MSAMNDFVAGLSKADFCQIKREWSKQVRGDSDVPRAAGFFVWVLVDYFNNKTGDAWPAMPTLARDAGISLRSAWTFVRMLEKRDHLIITAGGGKPADGKPATNHYRMAKDGAALVPLPYPSGQHRLV